MLLSVLFDKSSVADELGFCCFASPCVVEELSLRLCTFNLHLLCCRLLAQVLERGLTWRYGELWVERLVGEFKKRTKYRTHGEPELTMMRDYLLRCALKMVQLSSAQELLTWQEFKARSKVGPREGSGGKVDPGCYSRGQLLGAGKPAEASAWTLQLQQKVKKTMRDAVDQGDLGEDEHALWLEAWPLLSVFKHERAFLSGGGYATSAAYGRSRSRDGSHVAVAYEAPSGELKPYAAQVGYYLRLHLPGHVLESEDRELRIAICDFWPYKEPFEDQDLCEFLLFGEDKGSRTSTFADLDYPVLLDNIEAPLFVHRFTGAHGNACMAFAPLRFKTGGPRARAGKGDDE